MGSRARAKGHSAVPGDNAAAIRIIQTGKNPTIRHLGRTHRVDLAWLHEQFVSNSFKLMYCETNSMAADIFTKAFTNKEKWLDVCKPIGHVETSTLWSPKGPAPSLKGGSGATKKDAPKDVGEPSVAAAAPVFDRRLVEFCCGEDSKFGQPTPQSKGCECIRLTMANDVITEAGLKHDLDAMSCPGNRLNPC